jgi:hypothetical protein
MKPTAAWRPRPSHLAARRVRAAARAMATQAAVDDIRRRLSELRSMAQPSPGSPGSPGASAAAAAAAGSGAQLARRGEAEIECVLEWRGSDELALVGETTAETTRPSSFRQSPRGRDAVSVATLSWDAALSGDYKLWVSTLDRRVAGTVATSFEATLHVAGEESRSFQGQADHTGQANVLIFDFSVRRDEDASPFAGDAVSPPYSHLSLEAADQLEESALSAQIFVEEDLSYVRPAEPVAGATRVVRRVAQSPPRREVLVDERDVVLEDGGYSRRPSYSTRGRGRRDARARRDSPSPRRRASPVRRDATRRAVSPGRRGDVVDVVAVRDRERGELSPRRVVRREALSPRHHSREVVERSSYVAGGGESSGFWGWDRAGPGGGLDATACCSVDVVDDDGFVDRVPLCGQPADSDRPYGQRHESSSRRRDRSRSGSRSPRYREGSEDVDGGGTAGRLTETRQSRIQRQIDSRIERDEEEDDEEERERELSLFRGGRTASRGGNSNSSVRLKPLSRRAAAAEDDSWGFGACMSADNGGGGGGGGGSSWWEASVDGAAGRGGASGGSRRLKPRGRARAAAEEDSGGGLLACLSP